MTQARDPTSEPSSLVKKLVEKQKGKISYRSSGDENSRPFELPARLTEEIKARAQLETPTQAVSMNPSSTRGAAIFAGLILDNAEIKLPADTKAQLFADLVRGAQEILDEIGVPRQSAQSLDLASRVYWLSQAHQESRQILGKLAKLLGHSADASLIQHVIDNQNIEDGIRRRLEDERTSWETKYHDARSGATILERQLEVALGHVAILERQLEEDRGKTRL